MTLSGSLSIGLQEWAVTCAALEAGDSIIVVRKGGIHERGGGLFRLEHERFALLPTWLHQDATRLSPEVATRYANSLGSNPHPDAITVSSWAEVAAIWRCEVLAHVQRLGQELLWSHDELERRFAYRDQPWLYIVALRVHRLSAVQVIPNHPSYAGCRSWIPLKTDVSLAGSVPVLADDVFAKRCDVVQQALVAER